MLFQTTIERNYTCDVLVIGGGTAGVFAAISAARCHAKTILIEKNARPGGTMTEAGVNFPGLFFAWGNQIIDGPSWESIRRTIALGGAVMPEITFKPRHHSLEQVRLNPFVYSSVLFQMLDEAGVQLITNAMPSDIQETRDGVTAVLTDKTGLFLVEARRIIDATGDANVVQALGYPLEKSRIQQPATPENRISGYDFDRVDTEELCRTFPHAGFPDYLTSRHLINYLQGHVLDVHIPCQDADTSEGRTELERNALCLLLRIYQFLRTIHGLENLQIVWIAPETGVRESNRIIGEHVVTQEEYIQGVRFDDAVCYAFYPIDRHVMNGIEQTFFPENRVGTVPFRALIPLGSHHVAVAGRCLSSDTYANSALRVQAVAMATAQAAGCAAALSAESGVDMKDVPYRDLCEALTSIHAIVPD